MRLVEPRRRRMGTALPQTALRRAHGGQDEALHFKGQHPLPVEREGKVQQGRAAVPPWGASCAWFGRDDPAANATPQL